MLLWLDLETTGLDPQLDSILEVACIITHENLKALYTFTREDVEHTADIIDSAVITPTVDAFCRLRENGYVLAMHEKSGLAADLMNPNTPELHDVEDLILYTIETGMPDSEPLYLAGASVHFDLAFIRVWMPRLAMRLSHRVYDTSTLKAFFGEFVEHNIVNAGKHRAKNDVEECLAIARFYHDEVVSAVRRDI